MKSTIINIEGNNGGIPRALLQKLPYRLSDAIKRELVGEIVCEEIRIRRGRMSSLTLSGGTNISLDVSLSREEMDETVGKLCGGSLYAHSETIKNGYIPLDGGIRAGVVGRAVLENGRIIGIDDISGICIRLPHFVKIDPSPICNLIRELEYVSGVLIYSPPGVGKTTLLRTVAAELSKGSNAVRVTVIDSRGELEFGLGSRYLYTDIMSGYPKSVGIEIALRVMNPRVIVCDEIGNDDEISAICSAASGGVALLASAHASDIGGLMSKKNIRELHRAGVFGAYVGISRSTGGYLYNITYRNDVEEII